MIFGTNSPITTFSGVFSSLGNIIMILLVCLFGKLGFFTALILLAFQYPLIIYNFVTRNSITSIPGLFSNTFSIIAIVLIYGYNRRIR
ncbi:MAG: GGDEF-domain containing protein, partial [Lachnospiraceae bacterium]|nr:GGDEF-domain containing protein [Lachnospiraceae bacterium]